MTVDEKIEALRARMKSNKVDMYYIPTDDFHFSEYVSDYFKCREFISGFNGSAGTVVVSMNEAGLWTDGRYYIQAEQQLKGSSITLYKSGLEGVPKIKDYIIDRMEKGDVLGCDGMVVSTTWAEDMKKSLEAKGAEIDCGLDLVDDIWEDRPALKSKPVMLLDNCYCGETRESKIQRLRNYMDENGADYHVITSLDDIAWLLNIRGNDIHCNFVVLSYLVISSDKIWLFADCEAFGNEVRKALEDVGVILMPYNAIYPYMQSISAGSRIMLDKNIVNQAITESFNEGVKIIDMVNPTVLWKAVKNDIEIRNMKLAHIKDGVAVTKFIYWIKKNIGKTAMTELSVIDKLEKIRNKGENYKGPSFDTIAGFGEHGAIVHYSASKETDVVIEPDNLLLVDTGGHYLEGTTDVTRTILIGNNATDEQKKYYTAVLRGNLNLCNAHFMYGCSGVSLDYLARQPLWDMGCNYNHGTGHGVGYLLNVHEPPNAFRFRVLPFAGENAVLEEGMITSDEPGMYFEGKFGIRLENLILCVKHEKTNYGQFMGFEPLTYVPFDKDVIDTKQMSDKEKELLNDYHKKVYEKISPHLEDDEKEWLEEACAPI